MCCLIYKPSSAGADHSIPGLPVDSDSRRGKTSTRPMTVSVNDQLTRSVEKKSVSKGSDKQHVARKSSADHPQISGNVTFTEADSPFHLWYRVDLRIDGEKYKSAGHYLVTKSLGKCFTVSHLTVLYNTLIYTGSYTNQCVMYCKYFMSYQVVVKGVYPYLPMATNVPWSFFFGGGRGE